MKNKDVVIGMKVVPTRKTIYPPLSGSVVWNRAQQHGRKYLYVIYRNEEMNCWELNDHHSRERGDFFKAKDFVEYVG